MDAGTKELPTHSGLGEPRSSSGSRAPCPVQCSGLGDHVLDPGASAPSLQLDRDRMLSQRIFPHHQLAAQQSTPSGRAPMQDTLRVLGWAQGRVGACRRGVLPASPVPCTAALGPVHCHHPQSRADRPWDEVKAHYFHVLATAESLELLVCCRSHGDGPSKLSQQPPRLGQERESFGRGADVLWPLPIRQPGLLTSSPSGFCRGQLALPAWQKGLLGTYIQISAFETLFL